LRPRSQSVGESMLLCVSKAPWRPSRLCASRAERSFVGASVPEPGQRSRCSLRSGAAVLAALAAAGTRKSKFAKTSEAVDEQSSVKRDAPKERKGRSAPRAEKPSWSGENAGDRRSSYREPRSQSDDRDSPRRERRSRSEGRDAPRGGGRFRSEGRRPRLEKCLMKSASMLKTELEMTEHEANDKVLELQQLAVARKVEDPFGRETEKLTFRLCKNLAIHGDLRDKLFQRGGVFRVMDELELRSQEHREKHFALTNHHQMLRDGLEGDMAGYSENAAYMGNEWWVQLAHAKLQHWMKAYFMTSEETVAKGWNRWTFHAGGDLPHGWNRQVFQGRDLYWNPDQSRFQRQAPEPTPLRKPPSPLEPPWHLLDIGSSYNRFAANPDVSTIAVDLEPSQGSEGVFKADFFEVPVVESEAKNERVLLENGKLQGIVAKSFDVAVLSLVLSYVPDPVARIEMVAKARKCLKDDRGLLLILEAGEACPEGWSAAGRPLEWSGMLESAGFKVLKYESSLTGVPRDANGQHQMWSREQEKKAHVWVLETAPVPDEPLEPLLKPAEIGQQESFPQASAPDEPLEKPEDISSLLLN